MGSPPPERPTGIGRCDSQPVTIPPKRSAIKRRRADPAPPTARRVQRTHCAFRLQGSRRERFGCPGGTAPSAGRPLFRLPRAELSAGGAAMPAARLSSRFSPCEASGKRKRGLRRAPLLGVGRAGGYSISSPTTVLNEKASPVAALMRPTRWKRARLLSQSRSPSASAVKAALVLTPVAV